jgi:broad specificity phosphatase PhoE
MLTQRLVSGAAESEQQCALSLTRRPCGEVFANAVERLDEPFPGGESYRDAAERVREFLRDAAIRFEGKTILIIGHRATHYALEHWLNRRRLEDVLNAPWDRQPGWTYRLDTAGRQSL